MGLSSYSSLCISFVCYLLFVGIPWYFGGSSTDEVSTPIPEISDADMAFQAETTHASSDVKPFRKQYRLFHATFAQFCYTGAQVAIAGYFINYVTETRPNTSSTTASRFLAGAQGQLIQDSMKAVPETARDVGTPRLALGHKIPPPPPPFRLPP